MNRFLPPHEVVLGLLSRSPMRVRMAAVLYDDRMMDDAMLAYLEKNRDEANPSHWIPLLVAEIRRLRGKMPCVLCGVELPPRMHRDHNAFAHSIHEMA